MAGSMTFYLLIYKLTIFTHFAAGQEFIEPSSGGINTDSTSYSVGKEIPLKWNCDYDTVNVYVWQDQAGSGSAQWSKQLLSKAQNPGEFAYKPDSHVPAGHDAKFHFQVVEVDSTSGDETSNAFDSATFAIDSSKAATTLTKTITSTDAHHHKHTLTMTTVVSRDDTTSTAVATSTAAATSSAPTSSATATPLPDNGIFPSNMSTGTTVGIGVAFASLILIVGGIVTLWIRHRNKRVHTKYEEEEKRMSSWPSDVQQPLPQDPRKFRHTLWAPEFRAETEGLSAPSPLPRDFRKSAPEPRRLNGLRLNGISQKSLPPLPPR